MANGPWPAGCERGQPSSPGRPDVPPNMYVCVRGHLALLMFVCVCVCGTAEVLLAACVYTVSLHGTHLHGSHLPSDGAGPQHKAPHAVTQSQGLGWCPRQGFRV